MGLLGGFDIEKSRKTAILVKNKNELAKISEIFLQLKVKFDVVQT